jgi:hypothetical protein
MHGQQIIKFPRVTFLHTKSSNLKCGIKYRRGIYDFTATEDFPNINASTLFHVPPDVAQWPSCLCGHGFDTCDRSLTAHWLFMRTVVTSTLWETLRWSSRRDGLIKPGQRLCCTGTECCADPECRVLPRADLISLMFLTGQNWLRHS